MKSEIVLPIFVSQNSINKLHTLFSNIYILDPPPPTILYLIHIIFVRSISHLQNEPIAKNKNSAPSAPLLTPTDICSGSLCLSLTYSGAPG